MPNGPLIANTVIAAAISLAFVASISFGATFQTLYTFPADALSGSYPNGPLIMDAAGSLYGTTQGGGSSYVGVLFKLTPPATPGHSWTETVLHQFEGGASDGKYPYGNLVMDDLGNLYGTATGGGVSVCFNGCGVVFKFSPPSTPGGQWTETILYAFQYNGIDGYSPEGNLARDSLGRLYGTTARTLEGNQRGGTVFQLTPPSTPGAMWTETVLHEFGATGDGFADVSGVILDSNGYVYGTTAGGGEFGYGTAFELVPPSNPGGAWNETILYDFGPTSGQIPYTGLVFGSNGALFGATYNSIVRNNGTVFKLTPPAGGAQTWIGTAIHVYGGPNGSGPFGTPVFDQSGDLLVTTVAGGTYDQGTFSSLAPPVSAGQPWTIKAFFSFNGAATGGWPNEAVTVAPDGTVYGTTLQGGHNNNGTIFQYTP